MRARGFRDPPLPAAAGLWYDVPSSTGPPTLPSKPTSLKERAERHAQNLMMALCLVFISNTLITVRDIDKGMSAAAPRIDALEVQVALAYREADARRDLAAIRGEVAILSARLSALESAMPRDGGD